MTAQTQASGPRPGDQLGEFRILHLIGEGAMGKVYEARQLSLQRRVALKVLPVETRGGDNQAVTRFYREARAAAQLHHPNIVPVYDFGFEQGSYYYAMQYVAGKSLHELIHERPQTDPPLDERQVATWMLNHKREDLLQAEKRHRLRIHVVPRDDLLRHQVELMQENILLWKEEVDTDSEEEN